VIAARYVASIHVIHRRRCGDHEAIQGISQGGLLAGGRWYLGEDRLKRRMSVLTDLKNRGVKDVFFVVCDGLKGLPDVVSNVWPATIVQTSSI
jgi:hypothetical protein